MSEAEVSSDSKHFTELFSRSVTKLCQIPFQIILNFNGGDTKPYHVVLRSGASADTSKFVKDIPLRILFFNSPLGV